MFIGILNIKVLHYKCTTKKALDITRIYVYILIKLINQVKLFYNQYF